jgi:hypothetical protein
VADALREAPEQVVLLLLAPVGSLEAPVAIKMGELAVKIDTWQDP